MYDDTTLSEPSYLVVLGLWQMYANLWNLQLQKYTAELHFL